MPCLICSIGFFKNTLFYNKKNFNVKNTNSIRLLAVIPKIIKMGIISTNVSNLMLLKNASRPSAGPSTFLNRKSKTFSLSRLSTYFNLRFRGSWFMRKTWSVNISEFYLVSTNLIINSALHKLPSCNTISCWH